MELAVSYNCLFQIVCLISVFQSFFVQAIKNTDRCPKIVKASLRNRYNARTYGEMCYVFVNDEETWVNARDRCSRWGGNLVTIPNAGVMQFIKNTLNYDLRWSNNGVWIGANARSGRTWKWITGEKVTYGYWARNQPSTTFGISWEDCAQMRRKDGWRWHDYHCHTILLTYKFICDFRMLPRPTTTTTTTTTSTTTTVATTTVATTTVVTTTPSTTSKLTPTTETPSTTVDSHLVIFRNKNTKSSWPDLVFKDRKQEYDKASAFENSHVDPLAASANDGVTDSESGDGLLIGFVCGAVVIVVIVVFGFVFCRKRLRKKKPKEEPSVRFENLSYARVDQNARPQNIYMDSSEMNRLYDVVTKQVDHGVNQYAVAEPGDDTAMGAEYRKAECCGPPPEYESPVKCGKELPPPPPPCLNNRSLWRGHGEYTDIPEYEVPVSSSSLDKNLPAPPLNNTKLVQNVVRESDYVDMSGGNAMKATNLIAEANRVVDPNKPSNLQHEPVYANDNLENERLENEGLSERTLASSEEHMDEQSTLLEQDPLYEVVQ